MKEIPLSNSTLFTKVDDEDFDYLTKYNWCIQNEKAVVTSLKTESGWTALPMTQLLLQPKPGLVIDHEDRDFLNNQKDNLRYATNAQNLANSGPRVGSKSGLKGVKFAPKIRRWLATITINGKCIHIGTFTNSKDAAIAYNKKAKETWGAFAYQNPIN